jgi:hypothetical protein
MPGFTSTDKCANSGSCTAENDCASSAASCTTTCVCPAYGAWLNCALSHCWNQVYSCEYQNLAIHAVGSCSGAGRGRGNTKDTDNYIPSVPAPANAPGACSCDISFVLYRHATSKVGADGCAARIANGTLKGDAGANKDSCDCCAASEAVSAFYNTCPGTSPNSVPYWNQTIGDSLSTLQSPRCVTALAGIDCHKLGFRDPGLSGGSFYNASSLPQNGTATLSDMTSSSITSPIGGATLIWRLGGDDKFANMTAVAASVTAAASTTAAAASASVTASTTVSSTASPTTTGATTGSSSTGSASSSFGKGSFVVGELAVVFLGMALL